MPQTQRVPAIGEDVTALMGARVSTPVIGADVTALMGGAKPDPRTSNDTDAAGQPVVRDGAVSRFAESFARNVLPSTVPSDYVEGPKYAAQHPVDAISLVMKALWDAHAGQAGKTVESAKGIINAPTLGGKLGAVSETLGHGAATLIPMVGPAAANAGEQIGSGDIAGGLGAATGLLTPNVIAGARGTAPVRWAGDKLHGQAVEGVQKAINPTRKDTKVQTARIAPEMLKRRVKAGNLQKLEDLAAEKSTAAGVKVDDALTPYHADTVDVLGMVDELEKAKAPYVGKTTTGGRVINDKQRVGSIQKLQDTLMEYGDDISVESMVQLRRNWDEIVNAGKGFTTPKANVKAGAARSGRTVLRDELLKAVPDLDKVNKDYSFWQTLEDVTHASNERKVGQKGNLMPTIAGAGGAVAAEVMMPGGGLIKGGLQAAIGAKLFSSLRRFIDSPGYQMWSAVQKERLADALMAKDRTRVQGLIHHGMVSATTSSRAAGRIQSGRPVPQVADAEEPATDPVATRRSSGRGSRP